MSFWFDEGVQLFISRHFMEYPIRLNLPGAFIFTFSFLLKCWMSISSNDYFLKLFPVLFGILSLVLIYLLGKLIFSRKTGVLGALLLAFSPLHIYYSQELTGYSLSIFLALSSSYCFLRILRKPTFLTMSFYIIATAAFIYNHSINSVLVLIQNLFFYLLYPGKEGFKKKWLYLQMVLLLFCFPCLILTVIRFSIFSDKNIYFWIPDLGPRMPVITFMIFSLGYNAHWVPQLLALSVFTLLSLKAMYHWHKKSEFPYLVLWAIVPVSLVWLMPRFRAFYLHRLFFFTLPAFYLIAAAGIERVNKLFLAVCGVYLVLTAYSLKNYYENKLPPNYEKYYLSSIWPRKDYRGSALHLAEKFQEKDVILHICRSSYMPFLYYHKEKFPEYGIKMGDVYKHDWTRIFGQLPEFSILKFLEIGRANDLRDYKRIWLVVSDWSFSGIKKDPEDYVSRYAIAWFNKNFILEEEHLFQGVNIYLYTRSGRDVQS